MNAKEKELVTEEFCLREDTYNICEGGHGGFGYVNQNRLNLYGYNGQSGYGLENLKDGAFYKEKMIKDGRFEDYKLKMSRIVKNRYKEEDFISNFQSNNPMKNTEIKEKQKKTFKERGCGLGSKNSQYGKKRTPEERARISQRVKETLRLKKLINST